MKKNTLKQIIVSSILAISFLPFFSFAAEITLESERNSFVKGEEWILNIFLIPTAKEKANAIEGELVLPGDLVTIKEIRTGNSTVSFWVKAPGDENGHLNFSGVTPEGFPGKKNFLFSVVLVAKDSGQGSVDLVDERVLLNDGKGSETIVKNKKYNFKITSDGVPKSVSAIDDKEAPENFVPHVVTDPSLFEGKYFLVFSTQDKKSGLKGFEVKEGYWGKYIGSSSPYLLNNQNLTSKIYVKAIDVANNERVVVVSATNTPWYLDYRILVIILLIICVVFFLKKWRRIF